MSDIQGLPARRAALRLLDAVLRRGETLEQAASGALRDVRGPADQALARAIAGESLRWLTDLDGLIDSATKIPLPEDAKARFVLRMMLAQAFRLQTPHHAIIATGLALLTAGPRRLAHGVFSNLAKRSDPLPDSPTLPEEVAARWGGLANAIAAGLGEPPELDLALKDASETAAKAVAMGAVSLAPGHLRLPRGTPVESLPGFEAGEWWVQDLAAQAVSRLLGNAGEGRRALDLCAAPGGKTLALAATGWQVSALDLSAKRLDRLRDNLGRTNLSAEIIEANALTYQPAKTFDAILLDAPCTATGTARRHPDVLHRIGARQIDELVKVQRALIEKAVSWLPKGTTFLYAVCSLEEAEGEGQARWIAAQFDLEPLPITADELPGGLAPTSEGWLRTHPGMLRDEGGLDGFFAARWVKR